MSAQVQPQKTAGNLLLTRLAVHERNAVHRSAEAVSLGAGEVLLRANSRSEHVFFPIDSVVSMVRTLQGGAAMELALIGSEGMVGLDVLMDAKRQLDDFVVQDPGWAYRISATDLTNQFRRAGGLQKYLLRFADALLAQVAQTAVCARFHSAEARLARWLLMIHDRTGRPQIQAPLTAVRTMLGLSEERAREAVGKLVAGNVISLRQQIIVMTDRPGLEVRACECYETVRQEYARTLSL
ncbi:MAG TPA: Crp/Fnr family transcriptional regulator [Thermoanaerobaculia bacterium]|nr:Crp/Fnr family transcriptional regulator [Thermoanaerobaculia bacterium]